VKILDSDHCIAILRGQLNPRDHTQPDDELAVTAISVAELTHGAYRSSRPAHNMARVDVLLATVTVLPFDEASGRVFGALRAQLEQAGHPLDALDLQIASIALAHGMLLVTHNQRHFRRVSGLALEDWMQ
jgi:tRNA(fMet)-specific endonuclease VapC